MESPKYNPSPEDIRRAEESMSDPERIMSEVRHHVLNDKKFEGRKVVFIMRGVPGSGKSTIAKEIAHPDGVIHSTDSYFKENGEYKFDPSKLGENHEKNFQSFQKSLREDKPIVVIDNTNIKRSHFEKYIDAAKEKGYLVHEVAVPPPDPEEAAKRNLHDVSQDVIKRMIDEYEK